MELRKLCIAAALFFMLRESSRVPLIEREDGGKPPLTTARIEGEDREINKLPSTPFPAAILLPPPPSGQEIPLPVLLPNFGAVSQIHAIINEAEPSCRALVDNGINLIQSGLYHDAREALEEAMHSCKNKRAEDFAHWASCFAFYGQEPIGAFSGQDEKTYYLMRARDCWKTSLDFLELEDGFGVLYSETLLNATALELMFWRVQESVVYRERDGAKIIKMLKQYLNRNANSEYSDQARAVIKEVEEELSKPRELRGTPGK